MKCPGCSKREPELGKHICTKCAARIERALAYAEELFANEELEFDKTAVVKFAEYGGAWVQAWVRVPPEVLQGKTHT